MTNQLSKGVVRAKVVKASSVLIDGVPALTNAGDGRTILNGAVAPTTEGENGDFYIDTVLHKIHGPKAAGVWPAGVSLVGPQGEQGDPGDPLVGAPVEVLGDRDDPESALANLLAALETLGLITDSTVSGA